MNTKSVVFTNTKVSGHYRYTLGDIGAADGVRTHDNWNHNPISANVIALEGASTRRTTEQKPTTSDKKRSVRRGN